MEQEYKERWVRDLRSGNFGQTSGALYRPAVLEEGNGHYDDDDNWVSGDKPAGYCCLGVLERQFRPDAACIGGSLYDTTRRVVGLTATQESLLVKLNDEHSASFRLIADVIEALF